MFSQFHRGLNFRIKSAGMPRYDGIGSKARYATFWASRVMLCIWFSWTSRVLNLVGVKTSRAAPARSPLQVELISITDCTLHGAHLLRRHVEGDRSEVDLLVRVDARHDEEEAGALGAARPQPPEPEHHGSLVLLHDLKACKNCVIV